MIRRTAPVPASRIAAALAFPLAVVVLVAMLMPGPARAAEPLSIAQVERVTGVTGLSTRPGKYDKAATNFVTAKGDIVVSVKVAGAANFEMWKSHPSMDDQVALPGLGDEAVRSAKGRYICFRQGGRGVCVNGMIALPGAPAPVTDAQLLELARAAAAGS